MPKNQHTKSEAKARSDGGAVVIPRKWRWRWFLQGMATVLGFRQSPAQAMLEVQQCVDDILEREGHMQELDALEMRASIVMSQRRMYLCRCAPVCPSCSARQVRLQSWICYPSKWRCRECRTQFIFEPGAGIDPQVTTFHRW